MAKAEGRKAGAGCEPVAPRKGEPVVQLWAQAGGPGHGRKECSVGRTSFMGCDFCLVLDFAVAVLKF